MWTGEYSTSAPALLPRGRLTPIVAANSFVALEAPYDFVKPASFITTPVVVPDDCPTVPGNASSGVRLLVNVITSAAGHIAVGVEPADGKPPPTDGPFELQHANRIKGNAIAALATWDWSAADDRMASLEAWKGRTVRLHVEMVDARLFSLRMACGGDVKPIKTDDASQLPGALAATAHTSSIFKSDDEVATGSACSEEPAIVLTESNGAITDARVALSSWALGVDSGLPDLDGEEGIAYALDASAGLVTSRHGIMDYGCQGSMVAEKLLAYSLDYNVSSGCGLNGFGTIRQQLLATPQCPDGKSFNSEDHEFHVGYAGAFEASAEMILAARAFAAHTADRAVFLTNPERLLCVTPSGGGGAVLVGVEEQPGITSEICSETPAAMVAQLPHVFADSTTAPTVTHTTHLNAHGKALLAHNVSIGAPFTSVQLPLIQRGKLLWPFTVSLIRQDPPPRATQVCQQAFNASLDTEAWLSISCGSSPFPAGRYTIEVRPHLPETDWRQAGGMDPKDSYVFGVGWLTNARPSKSGSAAHRMITPDSDPASASDAAIFPLRLRERLRRAMEWQLRRSRRPSGDYGLLCAAMPPPAPLDCPLTFACRQRHRVCCSARPSRVPRKPGPRFVPKQRVVRSTEDRLEKRLPQPSVSAFAGGVS